MSNPLEEFLEEYGEKTAGPMGLLGGFGRDAAGSFGNAVVIGAGAAAATAAIGGAVQGITALHDAATKGRDFRQMMEFNPDLHDQHQQDPRMFNQMYTSLRSANPSFAKDPLIAGTYMRRMLDNQSGAGGYLAEAMRAVPGGGPSSLLADAGKAGRDSAAGHMRDKTPTPFNRPKPSAEQELADIKNRRQLDYLKANEDYVPGFKSQRS